MMPDPTEVMPTRNPANRPIIVIPINDFIVGGQFATRSWISPWDNSKMGMQTSSNPIADLMKSLTPVP